MADRGNILEFEDITDTKLEEILNNKDSKSTKQATENAKKRFFTYILRKGQDCKEFEPEKFVLPINLATSTKLDLYLKTFFASVRSKKGEYLKKNSYISLKYGLKRFYEGVCDITDRAIFPQWNKMFAAMLKELKNSGKSETEHTKPLSADDLNMCREYFSEYIDQPEVLQMYVWFVITLCLGLRGREKQRKMTWDTIKVYQDKDGKKYLAEVS